MFDGLLDDARGRLDDAIELRRDLHRMPELGLHLPHAQEAVLEALAGLPLTVTTGEATTSVVATLDGDTALAVVGSEGPDNRVVGARLEVPAGGTAVRTFRFSVGAGDVVLEPSGRADPTRWRIGDVELSDETEHVLEL